MGYMLIGLFKLGILVFLVKLAWVSFNNWLEGEQGDENVR